MVENESRVVKTERGRGKGREESGKERERRVESGKERERRVVKREREGEGKEGELGR